MTKSLVIVESPAKVKTINKILGDKYKVVSSMGHLIDLPKSTLGVDLEDIFEAAHQLRSLFDEIVDPLRVRVIHFAGDRKNFPALFQSKIAGDERPAL